MPQFDFFCYATQVFWLLTSYAFFYLFFLYFFVVRYSEVLKFRKKLNETIIGHKQNKTQVYDLFIKKVLNPFN